MPAVTVGGRGAMTTRLGARNIIFLCVAAVAAAGFARLGVWQLDRLAQRRGRNALIVERLRARSHAPASDVAPRAAELAYA